MTGNDGGRAGEKSSMEQVSAVVVVVWWSGTGGRAAGAGGRRRSGRGRGPGQVRRAKAEQQ